MATTQCTQTDYDNAAHWDNGIPTAGDNAVFPASNANIGVLDAGNAADGIDLASLVTMPGFMGYLGTTGDPIEGATALLHIMGGGKVFWNCAKNSDSQDCNEARIECSDPKAKVTLGGQSSDAGEFDLVNLLSGDLLLQTGIAFKSDCDVKMASRRAKLTTESGTATIPKFEQDGGESFLDNIVTELMLRSGTCTKDVNKAPTINVFAGARLIYNHAAVAGEVLRVTVWPGGIFDMMQNGAAKVIDQLIEWPGAKVLWTKPLHTITDHIEVGKIGIAA